MQWAGAQESSAVSDARRYKYVICPHGNCRKIVHSNKFADHMHKLHNESIVNRGRGRGSTNDHSLFLCVGSGEFHPDHVAVYNPTATPQNLRVKEQRSFLSQHHNHVVRNYKLTDQDQKRMTEAFVREFPELVGRRRTQLSPVPRSAPHSRGKQIPLSGKKMPISRNARVDLDESDASEEYHIDFGPVDSEVSQAVQFIPHESPPASITDSDILEAIAGTDHRVEERDKMVQTIINDILDRIIPNEVSGEEIAYPPEIIDIQEEVQHSDNLLDTLKNLQFSTMELPQVEACILPPREDTLGDWDPETAAFNMVYSDVLRNVPQTPELATTLSQILSSADNTPGASTPLTAEAAGNEEETTPSHNDYLQNSVTYLHELNELKNAVVNNLFSDNIKMHEARLFARTRAYEAMRELFNIKETAQRDDNRGDTYDVETYDTIMKLHKIKDKFIKSLLIENKTLHPDLFALNELLQKMK